MPKIHALRGTLFALFTLLLVAGGPGRQAHAGIEEEAQAALAKLYRLVPGTEALAKKAKGVLVFPNIVKAGLLIGGEYGKGVLFKNGAPAGRYNIVSASYGLQIGAQAYSLALFFMTDEALEYLDKSEGFELGVDAGFALADVGKGGQLTTSNVQDPIMAFAYGQAGLMAGISIEGSKITRLDD